MCPEAVLIENKTNIGFGRANNQAFEKSKGKFVLLLNTDAFIVEGSFNDMLDWFTAAEKCAVAGVKLVNQDGSLQPSCRYFPTPFKLFANRVGLNRLISTTTQLDDLRWPHDQVRYCDWVPGCFYLIRRNSLSGATLFDAKFFLYYEEVDQCFELKAKGWLVAFYPHITVHHIGGESAKSEGTVDSVSKQLSHLQMESEFIFFRKNFGLLALLILVASTCAVTSATFVKHLLSGRGLSTSKQNFNHFLAQMQLLRKTKLGKESTR
jgi:N-acetylglucosaminyl-diphospho-decaprenol L-rhamnosyltransferase